MATIKVSTTPASTSDVVIVSQGSNSDIVKVIPVPQSETSIKIIADTTPQIKISSALPDSPAVLSVIPFPGKKGEKGDQGIQGIQGEVGPVGPQGLRGFEYSTSRVGVDQYKIGEVIFYQNKYYIALHDNDAITPDDSTWGTTYWAEQQIMGIQGEQGIQGPQGIQGQKGDKGDKGDIGGYYEHNQTAVSNTWHITHNLGFYPNVTIMDSGGSIIEAELWYNNTNSLDIHFSAGMSGKAYLS